MHSSKPIPVDALVVCTATTLGNRRSEDELVAALRELGVEIGVASTDYGLIGHLPMSQNLIDLTRAASARWAVQRALRRVAPRAIIYGTGGAGYLEPAGRLARGAIRFDSLAAENRPGWRHVLQRLLERRMVRHAALLLPFSSEDAWPALARAHARTPVALPTPVEPHPLVAAREPIVVTYAGAPEKKGLDLAIAAWKLAALPEPYRLHVTGIGASAGQRWVAGRGLSEPPGVIWRGKLDRPAHRLLTATAEMYLSASRYEDFGIAQLEALADGALLVTAPSAGRYVALALARELDPALVAAEDSASELASALRHGHDLDPDARIAYRRRAFGLMAVYTRAAFRERLAANVLPVLLTTGRENDPT